MLQLLVTSLAAIIVLFYCATNFKSASSAVGQPYYHVPEHTFMMHGQLNRRVEHKSLFNFDKSKYFCPS